MLNALRSRQIDKVGQVLTMDPDQLLSIRNFGPRSLTELRQKLAEYGYLPESEIDVFAGDRAPTTGSTKAATKTKTVSIPRKSPRRLPRCGTMTLPPVRGDSQGNGGDA